jgi:hypothetical protein
MPYSVTSNKVTTIELDMHDLRSLLAEMSHAILGDVEKGFERKIETEPLLVTERGAPTLTGMRVTITDTLPNTTRRIDSVEARMRRLEP